MNRLIPRTLSAALTVAAAVLALAALPQAAAAAPKRTATTTPYTTTTYLQHALGLPSTDTSPAIEPVTYDRFQWLLQQPGDIAVLIGDPALDATFAARARDVEAAAQSAGVKKVYWFDPNLSGNAQVGSTTEPNLDIRNPAGITSVAAASQAKYGNAWLNLVGQYLGNGVTATVNGVNGETATVTATTGTATVNDAGATAGSSTEVGNSSGGALYDYSTGSAPATVSHSYFFVYDKDNTAPGGGAAKIVAWTDLTTQPSGAQTKADVTTAITKRGAANLAVLDQFAWWKDEVNAKQATQASTVARGVNVPVLTAADNAAADGGWRIQQITYPELVDLLKNATTANAVILFGGTWCPNTRPVLPSVNEDAQDNDVTVYNFDTVLDGGLAGGSTTSASNPLQIRNTVTSGTTANANPTSLYGDVLSQYLTNIKTQYLPATTPVTFYPGGDTSGTLTSINKLQVPFLIGYQGNGGSDPQRGVTRQWIIDDGDGTYTEYMSQWWFTNPQPNQLGITQIPLGAPIWSTINAALATFTWQTDPTTLYPNTAIDTDDAQYLVSDDRATVTPNLTTGAVSVSSSTSGTAVAIGPDRLSAALSALGASAPATLAAAKTALVTALQATTPDPVLTGNLTTVVGAWGVAQTRKTRVISTWGNATTPGSVAGGIAAVHALEVFFDGLPGPSVSGPPPETPGGETTVDGSTTVPAATTPVVTTTPVGATTVGTPSVSRTKVSKVKGAVVTAPSSKKAGRYKVTITVPKGAAAASGRVTLTLKQGKATKKVTATLARGVARLALPKLTRGTWKVTIAWSGDTRYLSASTKGAAIKVKK